MVKINVKQIYIIDASAMEIEERKKKERRETKE